MANDALKHIRINKMTLSYFKGIKSLVIDFGGKDTNISADNGLGKTTIFDAFTWCLFGKDATNKEKFSIKTTDAGRVIPKVEHEVELQLTVGNEDVTLRRVYKEKYKKPKGSTSYVFDGHETEFYVNEVPQKKNEYEKRVAEILPEDKFKLITNPLYFNTVVSWQERRQTLITMAGDLTPDDVLANLVNEDNIDKFSNLMDVINSTKTIEDYAKEINAKIKKINEEVEHIPIRIDEVERGKPEPVNEAEVMEQVKPLQERADELEALINDEVEAANKQNKVVVDALNELSNKRKKLSELEGNITTPVNTAAQEAGQKVQAAQTELNGATQRVESLKRTLTSSEQDVKELEAKKQKLYDEFDSKKAEQPNLTGIETTCGICNKPYAEITGEDPEKIAREQHAARQSQELAQITSRGKTVVADLKAAEELVAQNKAALQKAEQVLEEVKETLNKATQELEQAKAIKMVATTPKEVVELRAEIEAFKVPERTTANTEKYKDELKSLNDQISELKSKLKVNEQIEAANKRIAELEEQERTLGIRLTEHEADLAALAEYQRKRIDLLEGNINSMFEVVTFKMYDQLVNGGEVETCVCLVDGVPFDDVNNAGRINAGIDIINALTKYTGITAPIFVDNRESVNQLTPTDSQVVSLIVTKDKTLKIEQAI